MTRFEQERAGGGQYDEDLAADRPFGAYYHWCALMCGIGEAVLAHGLLSAPHFGHARSDLEASLPGLRDCRRLLVEIPATLEEHLGMVRLLRDAEALARLHRLHDAFGQALREEQLARELFLLDQ